MPRLTALALVAAAGAATAAVTPGIMAPDFAVTDSNGKLQRLSAYRGRTVVLEWNNPGCPFVQKHYGSGNMQKAQAAARAQGAVWLTVNSGGPGKQGYLDGVQANAFVTKEKATPTAYLLDAKGVAGRAFKATTTPDMVVIDKAGRVVFAGGIDDKATADPADIKSARNHVLSALAELKAGKPVSVASARSYGCSVKYAG